MLLTLIKIKWYNEYIFIQKHMFSSMVEQSLKEDYNKLKKDLLKNKGIELNKDDSMELILKTNFKAHFISILNRLFDNKYNINNGYSYKSISNRDYFNYYFKETYEISYYKNTGTYLELRLSDNFELNKSLIDKDFDINNISSVNKYNNYYLSQISYNMKAEELEIPLKDMVYINKISGNKLFTDTIIDYMIKNNVDFSNNFKTYVLEELHNNDILRKKSIIEVLESKDNLFTWDELYEISLNKLKKHTESNPVYDECLSELLGCCIKENRILDEVACKIVKDLIVNNPISYFSYFIAYVNESLDYVELRIKDIWFDQIFTFEEFTKLVNNPEYDIIENIGILRNFWTICINCKTKSVEASNPNNLDIELQNIIDRLDNIKIGLEKYIQEPDSMYKESYKIEDLKYINLQNNTAIFENINGIVELGFAYFEDINELKIKGGRQSYK